MLGTLGNIVTVPENGLKKTIRTMHALERLTLNKHPEFINWVKTQFSSDCPACLPGQLWTWVKTNFRFKDDKPFDEVIRAPHLMLLTKHGDCDDYSVFIKTVLDIIGTWKADYMILAKKPGEFSHVLVVATRNQPGITDKVYIDGLHKGFNKLHSSYRYYKIV